MILLHVLQMRTCLGFPVWSESYTLVGTKCHEGKSMSSSGLPEEGKLMPKSIEEVLHLTCLFKCSVKH